MAHMNGKEQERKEESFQKKIPLTFEQK